jgi:hypothetical protein
LQRSGSTFDRGQIYQPAIEELAAKSLDIYEVYSWDSLNQVKTTNHWDILGSMPAVKVSNFCYPAVQIPPRPIPGSAPEMWVWKVGMPQTLSIFRQHLKWSTGDITIYNHPHTTVYVHIERHIYRYNTFL